MEIIKRLSKIRRRHRNNILTIGTFDGIHLGHQAIIKNVLNHARFFKRRSVVLTFYPHPSEVLGSNGKSITTLEEKIRLIKELGVGVLIILRFTRKLASLSPVQFIKKVLLRLAPLEIIVGFNHTFGRGGKGRPEQLKKFGKVHHFKVTIINLKVSRGKYVNSTGIRVLIRDGDVGKAKDELGRYFSITGEVVKGKGRGEVLGFPTANLRIPSSKILPENGVYASYVWIAGKKYKGIANLGCRPTFREKLKYPRVEVFIIGFKGKLYGRSLKVEFVERIREEKKFNGTEALKLQIKKDILKMKGVQWL